MGLARVGCEPPARMSIVLTTKNSFSRTWSIVSPMWERHLLYREKFADEHMLVWHQGHNRDVRAERGDNVAAEQFLGLRLSVTEKRGNQQRTACRLAWARLSSATSRSQAARRPSPRSSCSPNRAANSGRAPGYHARISDLPSYRVFGIRKVTGGVTKLPRAITLIMFESVRKRHQASRLLLPPASSYTRLSMRPPPQHEYAPIEHAGLPDLAYLADHGRQPLN